MGVAPALNIDQESILFATSVRNGTDEFKLTLVDPALAITVPDDGKVTALEKTVTVPYNISGADAGETTRAAVLVLDREYMPGNPNDTTILGYSALGSASGTDGTFRLPDGCELNGWGKDYFVYILAENRNEALETDYASVPVAVNAPER